MKNNIKHIIRNILNEYSADQRLPFDDDEFKNKNYLEQYTDWLEDFGKYGKLPPSKLDFWEELEKAIKYIIENNLQGEYDLGLEGYNKEEILNELYNIFGEKLNFTDDDKLYVEREVVIDKKANYYDGSTRNGVDPKILYNKLVQNYNNNVGGCWSYRLNGSESYCTHESGDSITMKGYIRTDDIDFVKTVLLNFHYDMEHEIRVKPNAKVELFEVIFDCKYKIPLKGHLIVNATYFGNNGKYNGEYAQIDDGFGNKDYLIDRKGNIYKPNEIIKVKNQRGLPLNQIFDVIRTLNYGFKKGIFKNIECLINSENKIIGNGDIWFERIHFFYDNFAKVELNNKFNFINTKGEIISDTWFDNANNFQNGFACVGLNDKWSFINSNGDLISDTWFDEVDDFRNGFSKIMLNNQYNFINTNGRIISNTWFDDTSDFVNDFAIVELNNKESVIDSDGNLINNGKLWFDYVDFFSKDGFAKVQLDDRYNLLNSKGKLISNTWFDEISDFNNNLAIVVLNDKENYINTNGELVSNTWFDYALDFDNGFAPVIINDKFNYINTNGKLLSDTWFDKVDKFDNGFAKVELNNNVYYLDAKGNLYDYETKQLISNFQANESIQLNKDDLKNIIKESIYKILK